MDNIEKLESPIEEIKFPVLDTRVHKKLDHCKTVVKAVIQIIKGKLIQYLVKEVWWDHLYASCIKYEGSRLVIIRWILSAITGCWVLLLDKMGLKGLCRIVV